MLSFLRINFVFIGLPPELLPPFMIIIIILYKFELNERMNTEEEKTFTKKFLKSQTFFQSL